MSIRVSLTDNEHSPIWMPLENHTHNVLIIKLTPALIQLKATFFYELMF
jgi:hypothetical protein